MDVATAMTMSRRGPTALGYLRVVRPDSTEDAFWSSAIVGFCMASGRALRQVFRDTGGTGVGTPGQAGWAMLLAELAGLTAPTVVVPSMRHLGDAAAQTLMCEQVAAAGGVVHPLTPAGVHGLRLGGR